MPYSRITHLLNVLLLALTLFGAATGVADAHRRQGDSVAAGEAAVFSIDNLDAIAPDHEDSRPSADKVGKHRVRESTVDASFAPTSSAGQWSSLAKLLIADAPSLSSHADCSSHDRVPASPRLQLKLQLGQAP